MIGHFPAIYPDELVYSWICRYYAHSGYPSYVMALEDILTRRLGKINYEFSGEFNGDAKDIIGRMIGTENLILRHTMFPYYARFAPWDRRKAAMEVLANGSGNVSNLLPLPNSRETRYLMYCPVCVEEDRRTYGETYYHRLHQIRHIGICTVHGCRLISTGLRIHGNASPRLFVAEEAIGRGNSQGSATGADTGVFSRYMAEVFKLPMDKGNEVGIGDYLTSRLRGTPYISNVGCMRQISRLHRDMCEAFNGFAYREHHLQKVFLGYSFDPHLIMMMAYHLGISAKELCSPIIAEESPVQAPSRTRARSSYSTRRGAQAQDWGKMDRESLPLVREAIRRLHNDSTGRPRRVTARGLCSLMGWPSKRLDYLPMCRAEVRRYTETTQQYWAREIVWAYRQIVAVSGKVNWRAIKDLTNIRRFDFDSAKNLLVQYADRETEERIRGM